MMRVNSTPFFDRSALLEITNNGQTISFNSASDFINFPGGSCKFVVRKDTTTNIYWAMLNDNTNGVEPNQRNVLALYASSDLRNWYHAKTLMEDNQGFTLQQSIELTGFQYPDWQFDGDDIIYLSRTAYGDGVPRAHDSNYITFGRVEDYTDYTPEVLLSTLSANYNYFEGKMETTGVKLRWKSKDTKDGKFNIYRSVGDHAYQLIYTVSSNNKNEYEFTDISPAQGLNYYKLFKIDSNGKSEEYDKVIAMDFGSYKQKLMVARDINSQYIDLFIHADKPQQTEIIISDVSGVHVHGQVVPLSQGNNTIRVPINLKNKIYVASITVSGKICSTKF